MGVGIRDVWVCLDELRAPSTTESNSAKTLPQTQTLPQAQTPSLSLSPTPKPKPHPACISASFVLPVSEGPVPTFSLFPNSRPLSLALPRAPGATLLLGTQAHLHLPSVCTPPLLLVLVQGKTLPSPPPSQEGLLPGHPSVPSFRASRCQLQLAVPVCRLHLSVGIS